MSNNYSEEELWKIVRSKEMKAREALQTLEDYHKSIHDALDATESSGNAIGPGLDEDRCRQKEAKKCIDSLKTCLLYYDCV